MKLTEAFSKLLDEHARQAKSPSLWQDDPWKRTYYTYYNFVYDFLEEQEKATTASKTPSPWRK